ncbi:MAG: hypothetical protein LBT98_00275 [Puniceicoccales bacterium]|jgi:hypothetical protein|nr:hypothetical protein [Puniceicoccales bacterium]
MDGVRNFCDNVFLWNDSDGQVSATVAATKVISGVLIVVGVAAAAIAILALCGIFPALGVIFASILGACAIGAGCIGGPLLLVRTIVHNWHDQIDHSAFDYPYY